MPRTTERSKRSWRKSSRTRGISCSSQKRRADPRTMRSSSVRSGSRRSGSAQSNCVSAIGVILAVEKLERRVLVDAIAHRRVMVAARHGHRAAIGKFARKRLGRAGCVVQLAADDEHGVSYLRHLGWLDDSARAARAGGQSSEIVAGALAEGAERDRFRIDDRRGVRREEALRDDFGAVAGITEIFLADTGKDDAAEALRRIAH